MTDTSPDVLTYGPWLSKTTSCCKFLVWNSLLSALSRSVHYSAVLVEQVKTPESRQIHWRLSLLGICHISDIRPGQALLQVVLDNCTRLFYRYRSEQVFHTTYRRGVYLTPNLFIVNIKKAGRILEEQSNNTYCRCRLRIVSTSKALFFSEIIMTIVILLYKYQILLN